MEQRIRQTTSCVVTTDIGSKSKTWVLRIGRWCLILVLVSYPRIQVIAKEE